MDKMKKDQYFLQKMAISVGAVQQNVYSSMLDEIKMMKADPQYQEKLKKDKQFMAKEQQNTNVQELMKYEKEILNKSAKDKKYLPNIEKEQFYKQIEGMNEQYI